MEERELLVIGGGPAGYIAAIRASQLGGKVTLIEKDTLGGTCLNHGCIPTRALVRGVEFLELARRAKDYGVSYGEVSVDLPKMLARKDIVIRTLVAGVELLLRGNSVEVLKGKGKLLSGSEVMVELEGGERKVIRARRIIIATGSKSKRPSIPGGDGTGVLTPETGLKLSEIPKSMVIVGGQDIGFALATIFSRLGTKVTILERSAQILPSVDKEIVSSFAKELKRDGIRVFTTAKLSRIEEGEQGEKNILVDLEEEQITLTSQYLLLAEDREAHIDELGLGQAGVETDANGIVVNGRMETNIPGILAAGDVTGRQRLAHIAYAQGKTAAENALGRQVEMDYKVIPRALSTLPEIASVGLTEDEAAAEGYQVKVGKFPFAANAMATILGERAGLIKLVAEARYNQILGVHIIGPHASDLIAEAALLMKMEGTSQEMSSTIHSHPTLPEALMEAAMDVTGETLHFLSRGS
jgi:dihydrolipoamide dehydrogenase